MAGNAMGSEELRLREGRVGQADHDQIEVDRSKFFRDGGSIKLFREYASGKHRRILTNQQESMLENLLDNAFCDNVCHQIVAEASDRLEFRGWHCEDEKVQKFLSDLFITANVKDFAGETHYTALRDGNYAVSVDYDEDYDRIRFSREPWWDGVRGVFIAYDVQGTPMYAIKEWETLEGRRRLVWFEDRLERYLQQGGGGWVPYVLPDDGGQWPQTWTKLDGAPLHIPVVHFPNTTRDYQNYGTSELDGGVLGFQDQVNDIQYDLISAGRMTGFQMYFFGGLVPALDKTTGKPIPPMIGPGQVFTSENPQAHADVLAAGSIDALINLYNLKLRSLSRMTRTPLHSITGGDWPSGEALLRAEMPAVNKANRQIAKFTDKWTELGHRAVEIANVFMKAGLDEDALVTAVYGPAERRDPVSQSVVVKNLQGIVSIREALRRMGYTDQQAEDIYEEMIEERNNMGAMLLQGFDKGQGGGQQPKPATPQPAPATPGKNDGSAGSNTGNNKPQSS